MRETSNSIPTLHQRQQTKRTTCRYCFAHKRNSHSSPSCSQFFMHCKHSKPSGVRLASWDGGLPSDPNIDAYAISLNMQMIPMKWNQQKLCQLCLRILLSLQPVTQSNRLLACKAGSRSHVRKTSSTPSLSKLQEASSLLWNCARITNNNEEAPTREGDKRIYLYILTSTTVPSDVLFDGSLVVDTRVTELEMGSRTATRALGGTHFTLVGPSHALVYCSLPNLKAGESVCLEKIRTPNRVLSATYLPGPGTVAGELWGAFRYL